MHLNYFGPKRIARLLSKWSPSALLLFALVTVISFAGCGGGGSTTPGVGPVAPIQFHNNRDAVGRIIPVLGLGSGFDALEVDSPAAVIDGGRPNRNKHMLFYEATGVGIPSSIGLVTADEDNFDVLVLPRTQVIAPSQTPLTEDDAGATDPSVFVDKSVLFGATGRYKMWYEGRQTNGTSSIIYAESGDGATWTQVTVCTGLAAAFASVRIADPYVVHDGNQFRMWFEGVNTRVGNVDGPGVIGYATSTDGISWTVRDAMGNQGLQAEPVFRPAGLGVFDGYSVNAPSVVQDPGAFAAGSWLMFYEAGDSSGNTQNTIGLALSADGLTWSRFEIPTLLPSSDTIQPLPFDSGDIEHPSIVIDLGFTPKQIGHFLLYYTGDGENNSSPNKIGLVRGTLP